MPKFRAIIDAVLADPGVDQLAVFLATTGEENLVRAAEVVIGASNLDAKPIFVFCALPREMTVEGRALFRRAGIPFLATPHRVARTMAKLADYSHARELTTRLIREHVPIGRALPALPAEGGTLDEHAAKEVLRAWGLSVTRDVLLDTECEERRLPAHMRYPVAVKIVSRDIAHKTDIGAVRLGIAEDAGLSQAMTEVAANARKAAPQAQIAGVLVSEMVSDAIETIVGVVNDPVFGPVVVFGLGGILAETLRDTTYRVAPFDVETAREMIQELRAASLFAAVRGRAPRDVDALAQTLAAVSEFAWLARERLAELDLNPVLVRPAGEGIAIADALMVLRQ